MTHIQQRAILGRLGFRGFVLKGYLILQSAPIFKQVCRLGLKIFRHGVVVTGNFSFPIASSWDFSSLNTTSFFSRLRRGHFSDIWDELS